MNLNQSKSGPDIVYPGTNFKSTEQLLITKGEGIYVYDNEDNRYIEGVAGLWCTALGYGNQELIEAATQQMEKIAFTHLFSGTSHSVGIALAEKLSHMVPVNNAKVFFGNSGSDANDSLIKIIHYYAHANNTPDKLKIITRERAYHGTSLGSGCLTQIPATRAYFNYPMNELGVLVTDHPHYYRGKLNGESESEFVDRLISNLEQLIVGEGAETIAAFIAEPICGAGGVIVPPRDYYPKVQALLNKYNIMFWADEVICGFGRTGKPFGCDSVSIHSPDMMTLAKQLSSGYLPMSASVINGDIYDAMIEQSNQVGAFGHGYTYSGHPVSCAVTLKALEIYERDKLFARAEQTGHYFQQKLQTLASHPLVGEVRGAGLVAGVELVADKKTGAPFQDNSVCNYIYRECKSNGLIIRALSGNTVAFCPPLIIDESQIDEMISIFTNALNHTLDYVLTKKIT